MVDEQKNYVTHMCVALDLVSCSNFNVVGERIYQFSASRDNTVAHMVYLVAEIYTTLTMYTQWYHVVDVCIESYQVHSFI